MLFKYLYLANCGLAKPLTPQQIVDVILHRDTTK